MIKWTKGNLLESQCQVLVNTVNCVGVMGKGIALQFKQRYPEMFTQYKHRCNHGLMLPGCIFQCDYLEDSVPTKTIMNLATKDHWKNLSTYTWILQGLLAISIRMEKGNFKSVAVPALGCANSGLAWNRVKVMIEAFSFTLPDSTLIEVYAPHGNHPARTRQAK